MRKGAARTKLSALVRGCRTDGVRTLNQIKLIDFSLSLFRGHRTTLLAIFYAMPLSLQTWRSALSFSVHSLIP